MAFMDNTLAFSSSWTSAQTVTTTADSTNIVDVTGAGSGNAPAMINGFPATNTAIGYDIGAGDGVVIPYVYITVPATTGGTQTGTVTITLSAAPDNGSYSPGTYTTLWSLPAITGTNLNSALGHYILMQVPPTQFAWTAEAPPRFYKLTYTVSGTQSTKFLAGIMLNPPSSLLLGQYNNNFAVV